MIKDYEGFKKALYLVDLNVLNEDVVYAVHEKLLEPELFKKLREKPKEAFDNAPEGEKVKLKREERVVLLFYLASCLFIPCQRSPQSLTIPLYASQFPQCYY